jgi:Endomembrane protein 70
LIVTFLGVATVGAAAGAISLCWCATTGERSEQPEHNPTLRVSVQLAAMRSHNYRSATAFLSTVLLLQPTISSAFYLPGVAPTSYRQGERVPLNVNHLTPSSTPEDETLRSIVALDYYHPGFHFCRPPNGTEYVSESLGSILFGDRISNSPYELYMRKAEPCRALCSVTFGPESASFVNLLIWEHYNLNFLIDGLPAGQSNFDNATATHFYSSGFALGSLSRVEGEEIQLHNHHSMYIDYHEVATPGHSDPQYRVVGVEVVPSSRKNSKILPNGDAECGDEVPLVLSEDGDTDVTWTYSVTWNESPTAWATRWDKYLHVFDPKIHWFSLFSSTLIVVLLVGMVAATLLRALRKDIARYNQVDQYNLADLNGTSAALEDGVQEDSGWKLVHGDVFRAPKYPLLLSVFLGSGAQLFVMTGITIGMFQSNPHSSFCPFAQANTIFFSSICAFGIPISLESRLSRHRHDPLICHSSVRWGVRILQVLQDIWRGGMEEKHYPHAGPDPRDRIRHFLLPQFVLVGAARLQWRRPVLLDATRCGYLVRY